MTSSLSEISSPGRTHMMVLSPFWSAAGNCSARARLRSASTSSLLPGRRSVLFIRFVLFANQE